MQARAEDPHRTGARQFIAQSLEPRAGLAAGRLEKHQRAVRAQPGEQSTMFFHDPAGNALEFKAFADLDQLFAK